ncbi:hypothetical protein, partial [Chromobacterium sphagni]|uniref:hypothetical protein n=1 Tax=Chromobacterium sphagni TaxID=1903179 RepID=UPI0019D3AAA2
MHHPFGNFFIALHGDFYLLTSPTKIQLLNSSGIKYHIKKGLIGLFARAAKRLPMAHILTLPHKP